MKNFFLYKFVADEHGQRLLPFDSEPESPQEQKPVEANYYEDDPRSRCTYEHNGRTYRLPYAD